MMSVTRNIVITLLISLSLSLPEVYCENAPVEVFVELDGTWKGTFIGYDLTGTELYRIKVKQTYRTINDTTQTVQIEDIYPNGKIVTGEGKNIALRMHDGSLNLKCIVKKSNGEHVQHTGRLVSGPSGENQLIWYSKDKKEIFRESVEERIDGVYYIINGMGIYGKTSVLMTGSYRKHTGN